MIYRFGECALDTERYVLTRAGEPCRVEPQVFEVLAYLAANPGRLITKDELFDEVWGKRFVSDAALSSRIRAARQAIGDDGSRQAFIRTVHGKGYEFIARLEPADASVSGVDASRPLAEPSGPEAAQPPPMASRSALPVSLQSLIGREQLLGELTEALSHARLLTLLGPGGVGKTSLAYELARQVESRYRDGAFGVELVAVSDERSALGAVATALQIQARQGESLLETLIDVLRPRELLLVLDNCEHVADAVGQFVEQLLRTAPQVRILATSREPLAISSERQWPVEPLGVVAEGEKALAVIRQVPSVALFAERARAVDPEFLLDESTAPQVADICRRLDGIPLAIELAASRARTVGVAEIAARLDERFRLLRGVRRGTDPRHHTLQDAVRWSYDLLSPEEQRLFAQLSVFAGQFELADAATVCGVEDDLEALDLITSLAERSMVVVRRDEGASGAQRYELLETLREYGRSRLDDGERVGLFTSHVAHYVDVAKSVAASHLDASEGTGLRRAESQFADFRAAQAFAREVGDLDSCFAIIRELREFAMRTMTYEALSWAQTASRIEGAAEHPLYPVLTGIRSYQAWLGGEFEKAIALADDASAAQGDTDIACGLPERTRANVFYVIGEVERGTAQIRRQYELARASGDSDRMAHASYMMSIALGTIAEFEEANELARETFEIAKRTGNPTDLASAWAAEGFVNRQGNERSLEAFATSDRIATAARNRWMSTFARTEASGLRLLEGDTKGACEGLAEVVDIWHRAGEWSQQWLTLSRCVLALDAIGNVEMAAKTIGAIERYAGFGTPPFIAVLRARAAETAEDLAARLGEERYGELHRAGHDLPVADLIQAVRNALLVRG